MAARYDQSELVSCFTEQGAEVRAKSKRNHTALHTARSWPDNVVYWTRWGSMSPVSVDTVRILLSSGSDPNAKDASGVPPLHGVMCEHLHDLGYWRSDVFNLLLERGANLNATAYGDDRTIRSYIDQSKWRLNKIGLLEEIPTKPAPAPFAPGRGGRGRGRGRGRRSHRSTWT